MISCDYFFFQTSRFHNAVHIFYRLADSILFTSLEHFSSAIGEQPPIPRGVTHGDELIYLFSTGVFDLSEEDWDMAWKMVNLWTNFAIYG